MPFLEDNETMPSLTTPMGVPQGFAVTPGADDMDGADRPSWNWGAAFRRNNEVAALTSSNSFTIGNEPEAGFNPWEKIKGTPDEVNFTRLATARNARMFESIKSDIARENEDRKLLDGQPWWMGLMTEGAASVLSPTTLLPGGAFVKGAKGGFAIAKSAASVGLGAAAGTAAQEALLQGIEQTRTVGESATAIGASMFLGGLLGAGGSALLSKGEWQKGIANIDRDLARVDQPSVYDDVLGQLKAAGMSDQEAAVNATVFQARYATRAERLGGEMTPYEAFKADGLEIRAGEKGTAEGVGAFAQASRADAPEPVRLSGEGDVGKVETGQAVTFNYFHNPESATKLFGVPDAEAPFGRGYEPSARYVTVASDNARLPADSKLVTGELTFRNPLVVDNDGLQWKKALSEKYDGKTGKELSKALIADGYDGIITKDKNHISEVVDLTTFDEKKALYQGAGAADPRGKITVYKDNSAVIDLFKGKDESTFMHEAGHLWLGEMVRDASKAAGIADDLSVITKWLGVDDASKIGLKEHEQWARGFEEYLRDGKAPSSALAKAFESFKQWLTTIYRGLAQLGPDHVAIPDDIRGVMDRMLATDREIADLDLPSAGIGRAGSMGAAANNVASVQENSIYGRAAGWIAGATAKLNPLLRGLHSPSGVTRELVTDLTENSLYLNKNFEGVASQPAVETLMKEYNGGLAKAIQGTNSAFLEHRKAGGQLSKGEFSAAVGKAMRRGDTDADPHVTKAAQEWRVKVFDPLKKQAIDMKLLPPDISVDTAQSYFSRMWNSRAISADEAGFKEMVVDWVRENAPRWADQFDRAAERRLNPIRQEIDALEMAKLRRGEELKQRGNVADTADMSESDIRQALRIVQGGAPKPKGVKTLSQFVVENGGIVDYSSELASRGITNKVRPGMVRKEARTSMNDGGWHLDDMARHAWEKGYFPDHSQRPSVDEFVESLNDDFHKIRPVLKRGDEDAYALTNYVQQLEADLARAGVGVDGKAPRFSTSEEMKGVVERVYKAMDAEADRKVTLLKDKLQERQTDIRIDRESRFIGDPDELGRGIADEVFDTLTGRAGGGPRPEFITVKARGPLKERTFNIPDLFSGSNGRAVEDFLEHDVEQVGRTYTRKMSADVELARKFGSVDMVDQLAKVTEDYKALRVGVTDEKQLLALAKREDRDKKDIEYLRDALRGTDPGSPSDANLSRVIRSVNHLNYLRSMGEVAIASLSETVRPAMVHGLMPYMETLGQTLTNLKGIKASVAEAQLAGEVTERILGTRLATLSEITDPYASRGPVEAFLENMTNIASKWNGIRLLTDMQKTIASVMTQNRILGNVRVYAELPQKERAYMAFLGIDQGMAERIAAQYSEHGELIDKVHVANQEKWTDEVAARYYRAALSKDVDSTIATKGVGDVPIFASTPTGKAMLQFKSFALASHQRYLLRGLQEDQARFIGGVIAMSTIGIMATWLKAVSGNRTEKLQDIQKNPGWWIAEGLDKSGIMAVPMELANTFEKATGLNPIKTPIKALDQGSAISQKNQNRSLIGSVVGPSAGLVDDLTSVMGVPQKMKNGEEISQSQKNAAERLLPFSSYPGMRQILRYVVNPQHP